MANKLSRTVLKGIVKECLTEIMAEAFFPQSNSQMNEMLNAGSSRGNDQYNNVQSNQFRQQQVSSAPQQQKRSTHLDNITFGNQKKDEESFNKKIEGVANSMTNDPILADIFKDTALTTLQEQVSADRGRPGNIPAAKGDQAARTASVSEPVDLFGAEASNKWAQLAFSDNIRK
jgi:hypothetical protein